MLLLRRTLIARCSADPSHLLRASSTGDGGSSPVAPDAAGTARLLFEATLACLAAKANGPPDSPWEPAICWSDPDLPACATARARRLLPGGLETRVRVALEQETVVVEQEAHGSSAATAPIDALLTLPPAPWTNLDDRPVGEVRHLAFKRMAAFAEFVRQPTTERRLPVVLLALTRGARTPATDPKALAQMLGGMAHVVVRRDHNYWGEADGSLRHRAFSGAVRIYAPGYRDDDKADRHVVHLAIRFTEPFREETIHQIVSWVASCCLDEEHVSPLFKALEQAGDEAALRRRLQAEFSERMEQFRAASSATEQAALDLMQELDAEKRALRAENHTLRNDVRALKDEVRHLNYRLKAQWAEAVEDEDTPEPTGPAIWFSKQASQRFVVLDDGVRHTLCVQVLEKLLDPVLRRAQMDALGEGSPLRVFPRKKSADGKRVILCEEGDDVLICEIYTDHDTYEAQRTSGWEPAAYDRCEQWMPTAVPA